MGAGVMGAGVMGRHRIEIEFDGTLDAAEEYLSVLIAAAQPYELSVANVEISLNPGSDEIERLRKDVAHWQERYEMARWRVYP